jgi:hypothetical protein
MQKFHIKGFKVPRLMNAKYDQQKRCKEDSGFTPVIAAASEPNIIGPSGVRAPAQRSGH